MNLGKSIHHYRKVMKKSQVQLGFEIGVSQTYLSQLETNKRTNPTFSLLQILAEALETPLSKIIKTAEENE